MPSRPFFDNHQRNPPNQQRGGFPDGGNHQHHQPHQPHQPFDSPPPNYPGGGGGRGGFRPMGPVPGGGGAAGFRPMSVGGRGGAAPGFRPMMGGDNDGGAGGFGGADGYPMPHAGQKRGYPFTPSLAPAAAPAPAQGTSPPDGTDGGSFAKLFIGSVPKTATEEDMRPLFEEHGDVVEVALLKDKRTGQQQGCCFIKYATSEEADRAIGALHNKYTLPGGVGPIQVRYADGERERLGAVEHKLFVGSMNRQATVKEIEEIFTPYGRVEDVYIMRDEVKQSRGCGFVKYSHKDMATAAIAALSGKYVMRGCEQPLIVRFADPKRPRVGESRGVPALGGPGFGDTRPQVLPGIRPPPFIGDPMGGGHAPPNAWHPRSPQSGGPASNANVHGVGSPLAARGGAAPVPSTMGGSLRSHGGAPMNGSHPAVSLPPSSFQQGSDPSQPQTTSAGQQASPMQKLVQSPQHLLPPFQLRSQQMQAPYSKETPPVPAQQTSQLQSHSSTNQPASTQSQTMPPQQLYGFSGQVPPSQSQVQHSASPAPAQIPPPNFQRQGPPPLSAGQHQSYQPLQQPPTQLAQALSQQTQALQASFQSSQQAFSQLQQQLQLIQQSNQNSSQHQASQSNQNSSQHQASLSNQNSSQHQASQSNQNPSQHQASQLTRQQSPWLGTNQHTSASTPAAVPPVITPSTSPAAVAPLSMQTPAPTPAPLTCNWTEHTSPEGFKYYYNSVTQESKWEKPEELSLFEQQQHKQQQQQQAPLSVQHQPQPQPQAQTQSHPYTMSSQPGSQSQQFQPQLQNYHQQQFHPQRALSSQDTGYPQPQLQPQPQPHVQSQAQSVAGVSHDPTRYQQAPQGVQEWTWKNNPTGISD